MSKQPINWKNHLVELIVVIFGITIAFGIENYAANRKEKGEELLHLKGIANDLNTDLEVFEEYVTYNEKTQVFVKRFNQLIQQGNKTNDSLNILLMRTGWISNHDPRDISYQSLRSSGGLDKISNFELRNAIVYHYEQKINQVRFLNEIHAATLKDDITPTLLKYADYTSLSRIDHSFFNKRENVNLFAGLEGLLANKINEYKEAVEFTREMLEIVKIEIENF